MPEQKRLILWGQYSAEIVRRKLNGKFYHLQ